MRHNNRVRAYRGFSLIELIVVIVLMAILVGVAAPRFFGGTEFKAPAFAQELASAARYAQKLAVVSGCPVQFQVSTTGYALFQPLETTPPCSGALTMTLAATHPATGEAFTGTVPSGITVAATPGTIQFAASGVPDFGASYTIADMTVTVSAGSGYVEVQ